MIKISELNNEFLDDKRLVGDLLSDKAVFALLEEGCNVTNLYAEIKNRAKENSRSVYAHFIRQIEDIPGWVDQNSMNLGREVFCQNAFWASSVLYCAGLIESYLSAKGSKVLMFTQRLHLEARRRIFETGKMVADVVEKNSLTPHGPTFDTIVKVRILHSMVRYNILRSQKWNDDYGYPVNQEDMAITLIMFSYIVIRGLKKLGISIDSKQEQGYHLLWRYVGYLLGVDDELLCRSLNEEKTLYEAIAGRQFFADDDSRVLAHSLLQSVAGRPPAFLPNEAIYELSRFFIGDKFANDLNFPQSKLWRVFFESLNLPMRSLEFIGQFLPFTKALKYQAGKSFIEGNLHRGLGDKPADFAYRRA